MEFFAAPTPFSAAASIALGLVGFFGLWWNRASLRGTTLVAPWCWAAGSVMMLAAAEAVIGFYSHGGHAVWTGPLRYAAATTAITPTVALLGAKRPQDRAWQAIVLTLWVLMVMPSAEVLLFRAGETLRLPAAWSWLLAVLVALGGLNYLPTRYWLAGLLLTVGQGLMLFPNVLIESSVRAVSPTYFLTGMACVVAAILTAALGFPRPRRSTQPLDQVWIDFRDRYGAVWGLRVQQRMQASSLMYQWNIAPTWYEYAYLGEGEMPESVRQALEKTLRTLLRRFVSPEWISARLGSIGQDSVLSGSVPSMSVDLKDH